MQKDFFRYFKYNANKPCPFWNNNQDLCKSPSCGVEPCTVDEIPPGLKTQENCERILDDNKVDETISEKARADLKSWMDHDDLEGQFCQLDPEDNCPDCDFVDLTRNPERFTGYSGEAAHRIWRAIYEENCFKPATLKSAKSKKSTFSAIFLPSSIESMCLEKRAFYRAISGLHSSITVHIASQHPEGTTDQKSNTLFPGVGNPEVYGPNLNLFQSRFDPESTNGMGPYWLRNLYFVYLLELRAITKAAPFLETQTFFTGNDEEDKETQIAVKEILNLMRSFPDQFDETSMFTSGSKFEIMALKHEFRDHFLNISRVMDCVSCAKCKLWGKLQVTGLGTALKILFSSDKIDKDTFSPDQIFINSSETTLNPSIASLKLTRNEMVALFNAFGRLSTSIQQLERFRRMMMGKR